MNLRPLDPQFPAACSPQFANDRILSATNDFDTGEHSRTSAKSAVRLHIWLHDLSAQAFTKASEKVSRHGPPTYDRSVRQKGRVRHHPMGLTLHRPDAILLSLDRLSLDLFVGLLSRVTCTRAAGWHDLIGACAKAPITGLSTLPDRRAVSYTHLTLPTNREV